MIKNPKPATVHARLDRFALYELAVQQPRQSARFLAALHGRRPVTLGEDFCGAAAISREWVALSPRHRAIAVDRDPEPLAHASSHPRLRLVCKDVTVVRDKIDILAAFNFAACELLTRSALLKYLRNLRRRLTPRAIAAFDLYGGPTACMTGRQTRILRGPVGERIEYTWDQQRIEPFRSCVRNAIHFKVTPPRRKPYIVRNAFVYDWRLWSVAELREAMLDAGFKSTEVHDRLGAALDQTGRLHARPANDSANVDEDFMVYVVGRI